MWAVRLFVKSTLRTDFSSWFCTKAILQMVSEDRRTSVNTLTIQVTDEELKLFTNYAAQFNVSVSEMMRIVFA